MARKKIKVERFDDCTISISRQKAVAILAKMGTTIAEVRRHSFCGGYIEIQLYSSGGKLKFSPYDGWFIRTYGCPVEF